MITSLAFAFAVFGAYVGPNGVRPSWGSPVPPRTPKWVFRELIAQLGDCAGVIEQQAPTIIALDLLTLTYESGFLVACEYGERLEPTKFPGSHAPRRPVEGYPWWSRVESRVERRAAIKDLDPDAITISEDVNGLVVQHRAPDGNEVLALKPMSSAWSVTVGTLRCAKAVTGQSRTIHSPANRKLDETKDLHLDNLIFFTPSKAAAEAAAKLLQEMIKLSSVQVHSDRRN